MLTHKGTKRIETDRLILRRFCLKDAGAMFENWASDLEVTKYLTWPAHANTGITEMVLDSWVREYEKSDCYQWAITVKASGEKPIGSIAVVSINDRAERAEIGYCLGRAWWRQGVMTEALSAVMNFLFDEVGVNRAEAWHDVNNPNSGRVMAKCGMKKEAVLRKYGWNNQGICDVCVYALLKNER